MQGGSLLSRLLIFGIALVVLSAVACSQTGSISGPGTPGTDRAPRASASARAREEPGVLSSPSTSSPAPTPTPVPTSPPEPETATVTADFLNLRAGASAEETIVTALPKGSILTVLEFNEDGTWAHVMSDQGEGWV